MLKVLIIDDEKGPREVLSDLVENFCPTLRVVGMASDTFEAEKLIDHYSPNLIFLDIEMPNRSGIQFLRDREKIDFDVIFTTAFEKYALDAIKLSAVDYLVKPIGIKELVGAVGKVIQDETRRERVRNLLENTSSKNKKIALHHQDGVDFIETGLIIYCRAEGSYTTFALNNSDEIIASKGLKHFEDLLQDHGFYRCHKSYLVNLSQVNRYDAEGYLHLKNDEKISVSKAKKAELIQLITEE